MLTQKDFNRLVDTFVTKEEFKQELEKIREEMVTKSDFRKVMTVLDKVLKEVLVMRQEQSMHVGDHDRINERLELIEQVPTVAHELRRKKIN